MNAISTLSHVLTRVCRPQTSVARMVVASSAACIVEKGADERAQKPQP